MCDSCIRLDFILKNPESTAEEKIKAQAELTMRNASTISDEFALESNEIIPDYSDDEDPKDPIELGNGDAILLGEDYGQGIA